jgi:hypothetical protein
MNHNFDIVLYLGSRITLLHIGSHFPFDNYPLSPYTRFVFFVFIHLIIYCNFYNTWGFYCTLCNFYNTWSSNSTLLLFPKCAKNTKITAWCNTRNLLKMDWTTGGLIVGRNKGFFSSPLCRCEFLDPSGLLFTVLTAFFSSGKGATNQGRRKRVRDPVKKFFRVPQQGRTGYKSLH